MGDQNTFSAEEFMANLNKEWAATASWANVKTGKTESTWKLTDADGKIWIGRAAAEPLSGDSGKLILTLKMNREKTTKSN
jgi:hypothetical protein